MKRDVESGLCVPALEKNPTEKKECFMGMSRFITVELKGTFST